MNLHIFNPEHDIALACNKRRFTAPHAAQELRTSIGWIPALWASDGDMVLVDDVAFAIKAAARCKEKKAEVLFVSDADIRGVHFDHILPWGWDKALKTRLIDDGAPAEQMPSDNVMEHLRLLSSRVQTKNTLKHLREGLASTCGEAFSTSDISLIEDSVACGNHIVIKSPWSSSGRGVRYVEHSITPSVRGFLKNVIREQGEVMVEPYYNKVKDFGMEFESMADGSVVYRGLSLFLTHNGAYTGNLLAHEDEKAEMLSRYVEPQLIDEIKTRACRYFANMFKGIYQGPFGVDMMIVASGDEGDGFLLHPCVEINLRRTMGHIALALTPEVASPHRLMHIDHEVNYLLRVSPIENPFVKVI
ncbi:MAG: hypothetical protein Q4E58_00910 [Prevotellaceae bacterium]|nr:hypothetical protein [Prevotellaceae bacterium]